MLDRLRRLLARPPAQPGPLPPLTLEPIGVVRNRIKEPATMDWRDIPSRIVLRPDIAPALLGLSDYSHIIVLFWMHLIPQEVRGSKLQLHPLDDPQFPLQGVLATRSQIRFNPIGVAPVPLLGVRRNVLQVRGLDAIDGTPVLDIKPYVAHHDCIPGARVPAWVEERFRQQR